MGRYRREAASVRFVLRHRPRAAGTAPDVGGALAYAGPPLRRFGEAELYLLLIM